MSQIHYFPRYSQKENMVTNNTLLLFSRLYNNSSDKFKRFINLIFQEIETIDLDTIRFGQQEKGGGSVPDGIIEQQSFKIIIETKLYGQQNLQQVEKHMNSFGHEDTKIFLWINTEPIEQLYQKQIIQKLNEIYTSSGIKIEFTSTTFKDICRCFNEILNDYDLEMKELIKDYEDFCVESGLIDNVDTKMRVILSGTTLEQNMKSNLYYAPRDRGYQKHTFLGLYKGKAVRGIGEIISIADLSYDDSSDEVKVDKQLLGTTTQIQKDTVKDVIKEAKEQFGYFISQGHRFFFVKEFYETEYIKPTKGGLFGQKYFDLLDIPGYKKGMNVQEIAELLKDRTWTGS